ncbi:hypothetical protein DL96DRAFT_1451989, partial [Flagelloscypha sp. PMI_526]
GSDYPLEWPHRVPSVAMTLRDTIHLPLNASDPDTATQWATMVETPGGHGRMRLGPGKRVFVLSWYHQIHCLWKFQVGLLNRNDSDTTAGHIAHCLNYLRQTFLCDASTALEDGDFVKHVVAGAVIEAGDAICKDW